MAAASHDKAACCAVTYAYLKVTKVRSSDVGVSRAFAAHATLNHNITNTTVISRMLSAYRSHAQQVTIRTLKLYTAGQQPALRLFITSEVEQPADGHARVVTANRFGKDRRDRQDA